MEGIKHRRHIICAAMAVILIAGLLYRVARWNENDTLTIQEPNETLADSSELSWNEAAQEPEEPAAPAIAAPPEEVTQEGASHKADGFGDPGGDSFFDDST